MHSVTFVVVFVSCERKPASCWHSKIREQQQRSIISLLFSRATDRRGNGGSAAAFFVLSVIPQTWTHRHPSLWDMSQDSDWTSGECRLRGRFGYVSVWECRLTGAVCVWMSSVGLWCHAAPPGVLRESARRWVQVFLRWSVHLLSLAPSYPGGGAVVRRLPDLVWRESWYVLAAEVEMWSGEICPVKIKVPPLKPRARLLLLLLLLLLCFKHSLDWLS